MLSSPNSSTSSASSLIKLFQKLDTNSDNSVDRAEFVAGRPDDVGESQSSDFYDQIVEASGADGSTGLIKDRTESADSAQSTTTTTSTLAA